MSFIIKNTYSGSPLIAIAIDDLGLTVPAGGTYNLLFENPGDVQASAQSGGDLSNAINAGNIVVVDPRDGVTDLSLADSLIVARSHNDPHYGIRGARMTDLDDVVGSPVPVTGQVLQLNGSNQWVSVPPSTVAGSISLGDLSDINPDTGSPFRPTTSFFILEGDGAGGLNIVDGTTDTTLFIPWVEDTAGAMVAGGTQTNLTLTYNTGTNQIDASVNDVYLFNTGDTLDSGTLTIASGASIVVATGASISWSDAPTQAAHLANKEYVDSVAAGLDVREPVKIASTTNITGYALGSPEGPGFFTGVDLTTMDGGYSPIAVGDRVLIKNQTDAKQNGIYVVQGTGSPLTPAGSPIGSSVTLVRSAALSGSPSSEVHAGVYTFVENGSLYAKTGWILQGSGFLTINTDDLIWAQFSAANNYSAGIGLGLTGNQFYLDINNLTDTAIATTDSIAFNDSTDTVTKKRTMANVITDLGIYTSGNLTASDGVTFVGSDIQLDITNLTGTNVITSADEMVFDDGASGTHIKRTVSNFLADLDVVNSLGGNGFAVQTAADTYTARTLTASSTASEEGIIITNGDGVAANPTIGIDIEGTTASGSNMAATDEFLGFNGTNNRAFTGQQIADGVFSILGGIGNAYTTITGDTGSATAASSSDTLRFIGAANGGILTTVVDGAPDTVSFEIDVYALANGASTIALTDRIIVGEGGSPLGPTVSYTVQDLFDDVKVPYNIGTSAGFVISTGANDYSTTTLAVNGAGDRDGLIIVNGALTGSPFDTTVTIGLDINGNASAGENIAAGDKFLGYNLSGTANQAFTGQEVADGVATILGFGGLAVTTINGQEVLTLVDTTRANKILSVGDTSVTFSDNRVGNNDWLQVGAAVDALSGYIVPLNATIVKVTGHTSDNNGLTKSIDLYVDDVLNSTIGTFNGAAGSPQIIGQDEFRNVTVNVDVNQDQKITLRGDAGGGTIDDTVITVWLKWRG